MANFARSLASGFKTGLEIGETLAQRRERERIAEIMKEQPTAMGAEAATPEQINRASIETQKLAEQDARDFGLNTFAEQQMYQPTIPRQGENWRTGPLGYSFGGQQFTTAPTQEQLTGLRFGRIADVIAERDPVQAMRMRSEMDQAAAARERLGMERTRLGLAQAADTRAAETARLANRLTQTQIDRFTADNKEKEGIRQAEEYFATLGRNITSQDIADAARRFNAPVGALTTAATTVLGFDERRLAAETNALLRDLSKASGSVESMNKLIADKFDPNPNDGILPRVVQTDKGITVMYGDKPMAGYGTYKSLDELTATVQGRIKNDPLGTAKALMDIEAKDAAIARDKAYADYLNRGGGASARSLTQRVAEAEAAYGRKLTPEEIAILGGTAPRPAAPREVSNADIISYAKELVGQPITAPDGTPRLENGRPMRHTMATATAEARRILGGAGLTTGAPALPGWSDRRPAAPTPAAPAPRVGLMGPAAPAFGTPEYEAMRAQIERDQLLRGLGAATGDGLGMLRRPIDYSPFATPR